MFGKTVSFHLWPIENSYFLSFKYLCLNELHSPYRYPLKRDIQRYRKWISLLKLCIMMTFIVSISLKALQKASSKSTQGSQTVIQLNMFLIQINSFSFEVTCFFSLGHIVMVKANWPSFSSFSHPQLMCLLLCHVITNCPLILILRCYLIYLETFSI